MSRLRRTRSVWASIFIYIIFPVTIALAVVTPGAKILAWAKANIGNATWPAGFCEMFVEAALTGAGDTIPKQASASAAWTWWHQNWNQYAAGAPQPWDPTKVAAGDLIFWTGAQTGICSPTDGHVAIYDGAGGQIEDANGPITDDKPVGWPCRGGSNLSGTPTGFVPMGR